MRALLGLAGALLIAAPAAAQTQAPDTRYCDLLIQYYDRYSYGEGFGAGGRIERQTGADRCRQGRVAEGERLLQQAIQLKGFQPPPRPN